MAVVFQFFYDFLAGSLAVFGVGLGYGLFGWLLIRRRHPSSAEVKLPLALTSTEKWLAYVLLLCHLLILLTMLYRSSYVNMDLSVLLLATFWVMLVVVVVPPKQTFSPLVLVITLFLSAGVFLTVFLLPLGAPVLVSNMGIAIHAMMSILAYGLCGLVVIQAVVFSWQETVLRRKKSWRWLELVPSLAESEKLFFYLVKVSFFGLSVALISGVAVLHDFLQQRVSHKSIFTLLAWAIFAFLLFAKNRSSWHIQKTSRMAIGASVLLIIGVVGSRFVIEYLVIR